MLRNGKNRGKEISYTDPEVRTASKVHTNSRRYPSSFSELFD